MDLSLSANTVIFLRKRVVTLLKTKIHLINLNKSNTSRFTEVWFHDFTDLRMKLGFYGGTKEHRWKECGTGRNNRFISITVFS